MGVYLKGGGSSPREKKAGQEFKDAKNIKLGPLHDARPGEGSPKKACVAPPKAAECFAYLYSAKGLKESKSNLLTGNPSLLVRWYCSTDLR